MDVLSLLGLLALGAGLGVLGGLVGIGGGVFAIPILGVFFGMNEQLAQGTSLVMVVPNVAIGLWNYAKRGKLDLRISLALAVAALPVTIAGARLATLVPSTPLRIGFALFVLAIAAFMLFRTFGPRRDAGSGHSAPWPVAFGVGALGGLISGLFSVGGALFAVPLLSYLFDVSQAVAQGLGLALVAPGTLAGMATYAYAGDVDWAVGIPLAAGGLLTVPIGVKIAYGLPERALRATFGALMVVSAVALILKR